MVQSLYRAMVRIRRFEERTQELKEQGEIPGSIHLAIGQEAIPVGFAQELQERDWVGATYRGHGWALAKGIEPAAIFAEMMGRDSSLNGGRGASLYFSSAAHRFLGENSIVGAGMAIAAGSALSALHRGDHSATVCSIGDGAVNQGIVMETMNLAAVMKLPLVFVIENNVYSEMMKIADLMRGKSLASRAAGFGIHSYQVDGNDPLAVMAAARDALHRARSGEGPTFVEAMTVRLAGHYSGDTQHYRDPEELAAARLDEPLRRIRTSADAELTADLDRIDAEVAEEIERAVESARKIPFPDPATAKDHVYV